MEREEIKNKFLDLLRKQDGIDAAALDNASEDFDIVEDGGASSITATKILMECENVFDIELDDDEDEMSYRLGDILDALESAIAAS